MKDVNPEQEWYGVPCGQPGCDRVGLFHRQTLDGIGYDPTDPDFENMWAMGGPERGVVDIQWVPPGGFRRAISAITKMRKHQTGSKPGDHNLPEESLAVIFRPRVTALKKRKQEEREEKERPKRRRR